MKLKSTIASLTVLAAAVSLSGCSLLYPNWNSSQKPGDSQSPVASASSSATDSPSATPTPTPSVAQQKAVISLLDSGVDTNNADVYAVAEVTNVIEDGGTCTLNFIGSTGTKSVSGKAEVNVTDTQCHPLSLSLKGLPKGPGLITVTYTSATHTGTSAAVAVTIP